MKLTADLVIEIVKRVRNSAEWVPQICHGMPFSDVEKTERLIREEVEKIAPAQEPTNKTPSKSKKEKSDD